MSSIDSQPKMYKHKTIRPPTMEDMTELAKSFGFGYQDGELEQVKDYLTNDVLGAYENVDSMVAPTLPVKYPRVPGYRPEPEDNKYRAWFWRYDIQGASDGPLKDKRVAVKDTICVSGVPLTSGSRLLEDFVPDIDATVVTRVLDAGGRIVGKTSCEHMCASGSSWTDDNGPVLNPYDTARTAGGSSGGSAVVVIAGYDEGRDPRQRYGIEVPKYSQLVSGDIAGKKVGLVREGFDHCDPEVQTVVQHAANTLTKAGATVEDISLPCHNDATSIWAVICSEGMYKSMVKGNGFGYHNKGFYPTAVMEKLRAGFATQRDNLSDTMKIVMMFGEYITKKYGNKFYAKAQNLNMKVTETYNRALEKYDVLIMPTLPYKAPLLPNTDATFIERIRNAQGMVKNMGLFNATGHPALTINAGFCDNLPIGMMIVGKAV